MEHLLRRRCRPRTGQLFQAGGASYEMQGKLGNGAVGLVRKAVNRSTGKVVAVKLLAPDPKYIDPEAFSDVAHRFRREGERGSGLQHDNLVTVLAYEENDDGSAFRSKSVKNPFIVMEFVRGRTLEDLIHKLGPGVHMSRQTLSIASRVASALVYLHRHRVIHRDVKPANIFLSATAVGSNPSVVKLGDFGVTKWGDFLATAASGTLTTVTQRGLGTLKYMSPEQALKPKDVTVRSDMWSLGITLFELFTGQILPSSHHVYEIVSARTSRASLTGKLYTLGVKCDRWQEDLFSVVLDMMLLGASGRPASTKARGRLEFYAERLEDLEE